nr:leucine--tRNA ligase, chloroplastic/mitochondrial [Tanacetum cinerariifolium]
MQGFSVLHPKGWDAFGSSSEQYAIQTTTTRSIDRFRTQVVLLDRKRAPTLEVLETKMAKGSFKQEHKLCLWETPGAPGVVHESFCHNERASNVQGVRRRFLDEGTKESGFVNIEGYNQTSFGEPVTSECLQEHLLLSSLAIGNVSATIAHVDINKPFVKFLSSCIAVVGGQASKINQ